MNPLGKWLTLARRGVVSPSLGEATWRQASAISRWGMGLAGQVRQAAARDPHRLHGSLR